MEQYMCSVPSSNGATGFSISHLSAIPEHANVKEHRGEENTKGQEDLDNILDVAEEKTRRRQLACQCPRKTGLWWQAALEPREHKYSIRSSQRPEESIKRQKPQEIEKARKYRGHRKDFFGEIDLDDEVAVTEQTVAGEADTRDNERPRDGFNSDTCDIRHLQGRDAQPTSRHSEPRRQT